jgi:hypothetical protein
MPPHFEYQRGLTAGPDWRFIGNGIGVDKESKRNVSNELGKAFARWFCSTYLGIHYFAPLEDLIGVPMANGWCWRRAVAGDIPNYVCGNGNLGVMLLEAKGRYRTVNFANAEFTTFRNQIQRAALDDHNGNPVAVKGYIAAARWATTMQANVMSCLYVEDPVSPGRELGPEELPRGVADATVMVHYANVFDRLQLPAHAEAIRRGVATPEIPGVRRGVWRCNTGPLQGREFVGGTIVDRADIVPDLWWPFDDQHRYLVPPATFFGVERPTFERVLTASRLPIGEISLETPFVEVPKLIGGLSLLGDGTVLGPSHFFRHIGESVAV